MTNILVTGSNGQLGNSIQALSENYPGFSFKFTDVDQLDISDENAVKNAISSFKPHFLINCAGYTAVDKAEEEQDLSFLLNSTAVKLIGEICRDENVKLLHISTDYVFDGKSNRPYVENDPAEPSSVYGKSKLEGEKSIMDFDNAIIIRTSWLYSEYGNNFFRTIKKLSSEKDELRVVFDQTGTPTLAESLAGAIFNIVKTSAEDENGFIPGIYHYSNEGVCSWFDFAFMINKLSGNKCRIIPVSSSEYPTPAARPAYSVLNKAKIKKFYDLKIPHWTESLERMMR